MKTKKHIFMMGLAVLITLLAVSPVWAQTEELLEEKSQQEENPAMEVVNRMAEFLSQAEGFSLTADMGFDAVQESGQKVEFGEVRKMVLNRPNHFRVDAIKRSGEKSQLTFDGTNLALHLENQNVYASVAKPGTVDEIIRYFVDDLDMRLPLAELLSGQLKNLLEEKAREADYVEESFIDGVACDHVAVRGDEVDMQLWIAKNSPPVPQRVVIAYKQVEGQPQFWARFSDWNFSPEVSDELFAYTPSEEVKQVAFSPNQVMQPGSADENQEEQL